MTSPEARPASDSDLPSAADVDARLRMLAQLSMLAPPLPPLVDMSPDAITARLLDCAEISALALDLMAAGGAIRHYDGDRDTDPGCR